MNYIKWRLFEKYIVGKNGVIINSVTWKKLQRTVKNYTIGYF